MRIPAHHLKTRCPREVQVGQQEKFLLRRSGAALHSCPGVLGALAQRSFRAIEMWHCKMWQRARWGGLGI